MRDYKKYEVWLNSVDLVTELYELTKSFPEAEKFGLINQIRRSATSIASNIAEEASRSSVKDFSRFLEIAQGSGFELDTQLLIARNLGLINPGMYLGYSIKIRSITKQLSGLKKTLKSDR